MRSTPWGRHDGLGSGTHRAARIRRLIVVRKPNHVGLRFIVESKTELIAERYEGALHRVRLGFLDCALVGEAAVNIDAMADTGPLARDIRGAGPNHDLDLGNVGHAPTVALIRRPTDLAGMLGNELEIDGLTIPAVESEDAVGFLDGPPTFEIAQGAAGLVALLDVVGVERRCERRFLLFGKSGERGEIGHARSSNCSRRSASASASVAP